MNHKRHRPKNRCGGCLHLFFCCPESCYMTPVAAIQNTLEGIDVYTSRVGNFLAPNAISVHFRNLFYCFCVYFRAAASEFFRHVYHVFLVRSAKQVIRLYARRIITFVTHFFSDGNWAIQIFPHNAVNISQFILIPDHPVPIVVCRSSPKPTIARFINTKPKAIHQRCIVANRLKFLSIFGVFVVRRTKTFCQMFSVASLECTRFHTRIVAQMGV